MLYELTEKKIEEMFDHRLNEQQKQIVRLLYSGNWVKRTEIKEDTQMTERQLRYNVRVLREKGIIEEDPNLLDMRSCKYKLKEVYL